MALTGQSVFAVVLFPFRLRLDLTRNPVAEVAIQGHIELVLI